MKALHAEGKASAVILFFCATTAIREDILPLCRLEARVQLAISTNGGGAPLGPVEAEHVGLRRHDDGRRGSERVGMGRPGDLNATRDCARAEADARGNFSPPARHRERPGRRAPAHGGCAPECRRPDTFLWLVFGHF